ncbi:MAG: hypothetical protein ABIT47_01855 [Candidatus Paceibacterota bacterium]
MRKRIAFSILKFVGVTAEEFIALKNLLTDEGRVMKKLPVVRSSIVDRIFATIQSAVWDQEHGTFTVEVKVNDFAFAREPTKNPGDKPHFKYDTDDPTPRSLLVRVLDVLNRYK